MVTDEQVRLLRHKLDKKKMTMEAAAAAAGMSTRTGQKWRRGALPSQAKKPRHWRTRPDPFAEVWPSELLPLLESDDDGGLQATTLLQRLEERYPGRFGPQHLRTLQRRVRDWRALHGPSKEVYFEQEHVPGREAAMDFTHGTSLGVTVRGELLVHLLFQFVLSFSKWRWVGLAFGETFEALVGGMQGALWSLGKRPLLVRTDNLSAATHELQGAGRPLTKRFRAVLDHYGLKSTRIRAGKSHENGIVEKAHDVLKKALEQALRLRGHRDFDSQGAYEAFVQGIVDKLNLRHAAKLDQERPHLLPLPTTAVPSYTTCTCVVRKWSTVRVGGRTYSVPSRLIGHQVKACLHADVVEIFYRDKLTETIPRLRGKKAYRIDYRHVIWSLVRKPGAFARYRYREELFPSLLFRQAYDRLHRSRGDRADIEYVRIVHLAASTMQSAVERALATLLAQDSPFDYADVKKIAAPAKPIVPRIRIGPPDLRAYDALLAGGVR